MVQQEDRQKRRPCAEGPHSLAQLVNWQAPHLWTMIEEAAHAVGRPWSPANIVCHLQRTSPKLFGALRPQQISDWKDNTITHKLVWKETVLLRVRRGYRQHFDSTRKTILVSTTASSREMVFYYACTQDDYLEPVKAIVHQLSTLRDTSITLDITVIRGLMVAMITHHAPEIFECVDGLGRHFKCPELYVRRFLKCKLGWSIRRCTRAGHKFPKDIEDVCRRFFLRNAVTVWDKDIMHPCSIVNSDQTQVLYSAGNKLTWAPTNTKQIAVVGADEKRAFTILVSVSLNGEVLPLQAIYVGSDKKKSLPQPGTCGYEEAMRLKFRLELLHTKTYWSMIGTMKTYVIFILAPYFDHWCAFHSRPMQKCIWNIDIWSVH